MRNSLRLFGLLTVLAGVNVYVFFFNHGTAPRDVLRPSSLAKRGDETAASPIEAARAADQDLAPVPTATLSGPSVPDPDGAAPQKAHAPSVAAGAQNGNPPKGEPGGNPGQRPAPLEGLASSPSGEEDPAGPGKTIGETDTLGRLLAREGFGAESSHVAAALTRLFDPRQLRGGQSYKVRVDERGEPEAFEYRPNAATRFVVSRGSAGTWIATRVDHEVETRTVSVSGSIDSSLYDSVQKAGEGSALAGLLVDLLAWDVNFYTDTHPGDYWKVTVEKQLLDGQLYRYGHILAAEYGGKVGTFRAFYWKPDRPAAQGHYYDEKGLAISKSFLKTPLRYVRVSSKFDLHRFHPILHREKAHLGIDYAAPVGTPVWASAGGRVVECAMKRGSGNTVVIAHANGLSTRYYHLCRFARGLRAGQAVHQKELIGFVGTTGLSTGPHLHFSVTRNGAFVDPSKVQVNRDAPVADRAEYLAAIRPRLAGLRQLEPARLARN